jgi:actin
MFGQVAGVVLDVGTEYSRVGFTGDDFPRSIFPSLVGRCKSEGDLRVGDLADNLRSRTTMSTVMECGVVVDFVSFQALAHEAFVEQLRVNPQEHHVLLAEPPLNEPAKRVKTAEVFFESLNVPALHLANSATLTLYATGRVTGVVMESGYEVSRCVPVLGGHTGEKETAEHKKVFSCSQFNMLSSRKRVEAAL